MFIEKIFFVKLYVIFQKIIQTILLPYNKCVTDRALPDITSGPEVRQIFNIRIVWKPDVFFAGCRTFKNRKKKKNEIDFFSYFFLFTYMVKYLRV